MSGALASSSSRGAPPPPHNAAETSAGRLFGARSSLVHADLHGGTASSEEDPRHRAHGGPGRDLQRSRARASVVADGRNGLRAAAVHCSVSATQGGGTRALGEVYRRDWASIRRPATRTQDATLGTSTAAAAAAGCPGAALWAKSCPARLRSTCALAAERRKRIVRVQAERTEGASRSKTKRESLFRDDSRDEEVAARRLRTDAAAPEEAEETLAGRLHERWQRLISSAAQ